MSTLMADGISAADGIVVVCYGNVGFYLDFKSIAVPSVCATSRAVRDLLPD